MTYHIHIQGIVQGVGFRPHVFRLAKALILRGVVYNASDGVHVEFEANETTAHLFLEKIITTAPPMCHITDATIDVVSDKFFENDFKIVEQAADNRKANLLLTPDYAVCGDCKNELNNPSNRRFEYPFITCTNCGPRYSITQKLPFDRPNTPMNAFKMCPHCQSEYDEPQDRRFYAQTNSCPQCGIDLFEVGSSVKLQGVQNIVEALAAGKIVAVKGIGGYLLMCDATSEKALKTLRERKHRHTKPFALMYPTFTMLENDAILRGCDKTALQSPQAPIVLLPLKNELPSGIKADIIAPQLSNIGVMMPYTPLFDLILNKINKPLVATSGNVSGSPIIYDDQKAEAYLAAIADVIISNNRAIVVPQDDSVLKYSFFSEKKIVLRRSRGFAPNYLPTMRKDIFTKNAQYSAQKNTPQAGGLALGAALKSTFSWAHEGNIYVSQFLGDLESYEAQENFEHTLTHFLTVFEEKPQHIVTDKHPHYFSTQLGERLAKAWGLPLKKVQHHQVHFAAVMAENGLFDSKEAILGVIWDGTGLGDDGQIWGGEFFKYDNGHYTRCYYFDYFPFILGDKMPKEPRISALSLAYDVVGSDDFLQKKFSNTEGGLYRKLLQKNEGLKTSSVGRLFDGVASLLDLGDKSYYEGEAAMRLEALATQYFKLNGLNFKESYITEGASYYRVPTKTLIQNLIFDLIKKKDLNYIAAKFHYSLIIIIKNVARNVGCKKIAFSGGVFQNSLLVDLILHHLRPEFDLFFHNDLSPNDENISFGQLFF